jgi:hypothetical protein
LAAGPDELMPMLKLFTNVFAPPQNGESTLPASLVEQLTERVVDGTDPRMRIVSGYAKTLRNPVNHAAQYVIELIDRLPPPLSLAPGWLRASPLLAALLYSEREAGRILARDSALLEYRTLHPLSTQSVSALLVVERSEKHGFGYAQVGEQALADVPQTSISFSGHRLLEPATDEQDTRRGLKRRAFDLLLAVALARITDRTVTHKELASQRALLRSKLDVLRRSSSFAAHTTADQREAIQARLISIEQKLAALKLGADMIQANFEAVVDVLANSEQHLWLRKSILYLDKFYVLHDKPESNVPRIAFCDLYNSDGRHATLQLVQVPLAPAQAN